ncbi:MAG: transporter [FCB group bacterium]|nr:transporter [FCB group bacterium]
MWLRRGVNEVLIFAVTIMSIGFAQDGNQLISGPLSGFTFVPEPGHLGLSIQYLSSSSSSSFDKEGEEHALNEYYERVGAPKYKRSMSALRGDYTVSKRVGLFAIVPFINSQELEWNLEPTYMGALNDLSGQTGLADIIIGGWLQVAQAAKYSVHLSGAYSLATGSSPDEVTSDEVSSTGSEHTATGVGLSADVVLAPKILLSLGGQYLVNQKANYTYDNYSIVVKYGNEMLINSRLTYHMSKNLALGLDANYLSADKTEVDGQIDEESESSGLILTPLIGHHDTTNKLNMRINAGYQLTYAGSNILKYDGIRFGLSIIF